MNELDYPTVMTASPAKKSMSVKIESSQGSHVVILGNGFDIFLNRPTKYSEFYDSEFCPKNYPTPLIEYLNGFSKDSNGVPKDLRWYDFENQLLGYYASNEFGRDPLEHAERNCIKSLISYNKPLRYDFFAGLYNNHFYNPFDKFLEKHYIKPVGNGNDFIFAYDKFYDEVKERDFYAFSLIKEGLLSYLNSKIEKAVLASAFPLMFLKEKDIEVFTFNYTNVPFANPRNVHYVHGSCVDRNIIIGTREDEKMKKDYWFLQKVFDPGYRPSYVSYALLNASKVSIFGHSLGVNDRQYFQAFFKRQCDAEKAKPKMQINIYTKDVNSVMEIKRSLQELTDFHLSELYQYNTLNIFTEEVYINMFQ